MKGEGANLKVMTSTLKFVVNCKLLGLEEKFQGTSFGHAFFQNMLVWDNKKKFAKKLYMFLLSLPNMICEST